MGNDKSGGKEVIMISIKGLKDTIKRYAALEQDIKTKATVSALNKTATQTRNQAVKRIREIYVLKSSDIKDNILISKATSKRQWSGVFSFKKGKALWITNFSAKMTKQGLSVKVKKASKRSILKAAFLTPDGKPLQRYGKRDFAPKGGYWAGKTIRRGPNKGQPILRQRVKTIYGPSISGILGGDLYHELVKYAEKKLKTILLNEIKYYTNKHLN